MVASFSHQIQSEYYGGNQSVCIEEISLEHYNETTHTEMVSTPESRTLNDVFHYLFYYGRKQDAETTASNIKRIIEWLNQPNILLENLSKLWVNIYDCSKHYRYYIALLLCQCCLNTLLLLFNVVRLHQDTSERWLMSSMTLTKGLSSN